MRKNRGFTLIELLIAALIFSIVILSIYSAFQTGILSYRKVDSAFEVYQAARIIFNRMESDLKNSFAYKTDNSGFQGANTSVDFFSVVDYYKEDKLNTDIYRIKYGWAEAEKILKRACYRGPDALKENMEQEAEELAPDIEKISFQYADKPDDWQDSWPIKKGEDDLTQQKTLPLAVKIILSLTEKSGKEKATEFTKVVSLPLSKSSSVGETGE